MKRILFCLFFLFTANFMFAQAIPHDGQATGIKVGSSDDVIISEKESPAPPPASMKNDSLQKDSLAPKHLQVARDTVPRVDSGDVFQFAEEMPAPPYDLNTFIQQNCHYPDAEKNAKHQGTAYVEFIIEKNGSISNIKIIKSSGYPALDAEAMRVVSVMPPWGVGKMNGKPVRVKYTQPFRFML